MERKIWCDGIGNNLFTPDNSVACVGVRACHCLFVCYDIWSLPIQSHHFLSLSLSCSCPHRIQGRQHQGNPCHGDSQSGVGNPVTWGRVESSSPEPCLSSALLSRGCVLIKHGSANTGTLLCAHLCLRSPQNSVKDGIAIPTKRGCLYFQFYRAEFSVALCSTKSFCLNYWS